MRAHGARVSTASLHNRLARLEAAREAQDKADFERFCQLYEFVENQYRDVPDEQAPREWLEIKRLVETARHRQNEAASHHPPAKGT